jgi:quercetin dioxygenase-like cupin family protein
VVEHVIVLSGAMDVLIEGDWVALAKGDAVRFSADRPHGYRNTQSGPAVFHNLIHYAQMALATEPSAPDTA